MAQDRDRAAIVKIALVAALVFVLSASGTYVLLTHTPGT